MAKQKKRGITNKRFMSKAPQQLQLQQTNKTLTAYGLILILFGFLCWFMQGYFDGGYRANYADIPLKGKVYGPISIVQANSNYQLRIRQYSIALNVWNALDIEILDKNKNYLFGFGDELWHESGYDDGHWDETKNVIKMNVHFEKAGIYYLSISAQSNAKLDDSSGYELMIDQQRGSIVAFQWLKFIALIVGSLILLYRYRAIFEDIE